MAFATARFRQNLLANQQPQFDAHTGKADALSAGFSACGDIMVARELAAFHAGTVVDDGECALAGSHSNRMLVVPESRALAATSVRIVSSREPG